ncbi:tetratricopeptide repeat protein [uncultured Arcticibacterium sp.]|uniref:tetratricopeptide repeat protein n=1 Tax=uncultured Arcticibacterium sp. TaxID=2173042 RepID=UPI0030F6F753
MKILFRLLVLLSLPVLQASAQIYDVFEKEKERPARLLTDRAIQIETTAAIDYMYNFNFYESEREFKWLLVKYPHHPIGFFLVGLNYWWRLVPDTGVKKYDDVIHGYMDKSIDLADDLLKEDKGNNEAAFFLAASYAFKGRLYAERENWVRAAWAGKQSLKYLELSRGDDSINPELIFGDGLYNFYSKWISENYKSLKPLLTFFKKGDKDLGITQLENVSRNAFYTRMEARYFLVQIYAMEGQHSKARELSNQMHVLYPNNSFFHRYAARSSFVLGRMREAETYAKELLDNIAANKYGYTANEGRYGAYILGYVNQNYNKDIGAAKFYYQKCTEFAQSNDSEESGYYLGSQLALGDFAMDEGDFLTAARKYKLIIDTKQKKSASYKTAKERIKTLKKKITEAKKKRKLRNR